METRVKERLTGAIILVAALVFLVPELLTGPKSSQPATADVPPDQSQRSYTVELKEGARRQPLAEPAQIPQVVEEVAPAPAVVAFEDAATASEPETPARPEPQPSSASVAQERVEKPQAPESRPAEPKRSEPKVAEKRAEPPRAERAAATSAGGGWAIQVGSFASRANADRLANDLKARGFKPFVVEGTSGGRKLYRVRVGPEANRDSAQALAERLRSAGWKGAIVEHP